MHTAASVQASIMCLNMYQLKILTLNNRFLKSPCLGMHLGSVTTYSKFVQRGTYSKVYGVSKILGK